MEQENQNPAPESPSLSLQDLVILLNVVRATAERGAIKADEMTAVGAVHDKLLKFLQASGAIQSRPTTSQAEEPQSN